MAMVAVKLVVFKKDFSVQEDHLQEEIHAVNKHQKE